MKFLKLSVSVFLVVVLFASCGTKPAEVPVEQEQKSVAEAEVQKEKTEPELKPVSEEKAAAKDKPVQETATADPKKEPEPEPEPKFTPEKFATNLQDVLQKGEVHDALTQFESVPEEYKNDFSLNMLQASLLVSSGDVDKAQEVAQKLSEKEPENVDLLYLNAMIEKRKGNVRAKQALLQKIIQLDPNNSDALLEMANDQMMKGKTNYKNAQRLYERSAKADDNQVEAWLGYGQTSYYLRDDSKAEEAFTKVLEKDPTYSLAHSYIAKLWAEKENYLKAQEAIEKAIAIDSDYFDYWIDYGLYLRFRGKKTEAINAWTKAVELKSDYFLSYAYRASLYDEMEEYDKSLEDYKTIVKLNPKYYYAYENLGMLYFKKGLWQASILCFEKALEYNAESFSYKMMIAANYVRTNERVKSRKFFETNLRVLDKAGAEYAIMRMYMDLITSGVEQKIRKEESVTKRGKYLFYYGLLQDLKGNDVMAKKYYTEVHALQAPMFFEYQINDWILEGKHAPLCDKKE